MTGITFLFVFLAGAFVGAVVVGVIHAERRDRRDQWRELARRDRDGIYFRRRRL